MNKANYRTWGGKRQKGDRGYMLNGMLNAYHRIRRQLHAVQTTDLERPTFRRHNTKGREMTLPLFYLLLSILATSRLAWLRFYTVLSTGWNSLAR
jgi:hypothetical protein